MPRFAANLSLMYPELPFLDRFEAAAADRFEAVEFQFPYAWSPQEIAARLKAYGLRLVLFNAPVGGTDAASIEEASQRGDRGTACLAGREAEFDAGLTLALRYAQALDCPHIHVMAGLLAEGQEREALQPTYVGNLRRACTRAGAAGVQLLIEPINLRDMPRYFLNRQDHAHEIIEQVGSTGLKVLMDLYHCQIVEGDVAMKIRKYLPGGHVGHFQIAGAPERQEPDVGELNYPYLFALIDALSSQCGWEGWVGCEYRPGRGAQAGGTSAGLGWLAPWRTCP
ncbi:MAG: TIM barrel protein [Burkholderiaceae bacterium]|nr:TIM barrel protein [Burkholderiaceae bacterium]